MKILFALFLLIDALLWYHLYRESYVVRSNMVWKYKQRLKMLTAVLLAAIAAAFWSVPMACLIAGVPAAMAVGFILLLFLTAIFHRGPWH
jgi:hypothetical protein